MVARHRRRVQGLRPPGAFLINVQAHTQWVEKAPGEVGLIDGQPGFTYKREGGQLALIRIPGDSPPGRVIVAA